MNKNTNSKKRFPENKMPEKKLNDSIEIADKMTCIISKICCKRHNLTITGNAKISANIVPAKN